MAGAGFRPVQVDAAPTMTPGGVVVVITDAGIRVEGLDLDRVVQVVTRLRWMARASCDGVRVWRADRYPQGV